MGCQLVRTYPAPSANSSRSVVYVRGNAVFRLVTGKIRQWVPEYIAYVRTYDSKYTVQNSRCVTFWCPLSW